MKYRAGQRWAYVTREEDDGSTLVVLRVEKLPDVGEVVLVAIDGLRVRDANAAHRLHQEIRFTEFTADALDQSVTHLLGEEVAPDRNELYAGWRRAFDAGEAGVFREPVVDVVRRFQRLLERPKGKAR